MGKYTVKCVDCNIERMVYKRAYILPIRCKECNIELQKSVEFRRYAGGKYVK